MPKNAHLSVQTDKLRVSAARSNGKYHVRFDFKDGSRWRRAAATGLDLDGTIHSADPLIEWNNGNWARRDSGLYTEAWTEKDKVLALRGRIADADDQPAFHDIVMRISIAGGGIVKVRVTDTTDACSEVQLGRLMTNLYFTPDARCRRGAEPLELAWIPGLHWDYNDVVADHVFRSPAAIAQYEDIYTAIVPDLDLLAVNRPRIRHALDFRAAGVVNELEPSAEWNVTRLQYGFCTWEPHLHVFYRHRFEQMQNITAGELSYGFDLFIGKANGPERIASLVNRHLWKRYGKRHFSSPLPQVMPFEDYGRKYAYRYEVPMTVKRVNIKGKKCAGINSPRRGSNFHAWENDLLMAYGMLHYGRKWKDRKLAGIARGIRELILASPGKEGAFPCIYNFQTGKFEGTVNWVSVAADPYHGFDTAAMGVTAWWMLHWNDHFGTDAELLEKATSYGWFLREQQLDSGAIPTWFFSDLTPAPALRESATTAISGAVLARLAMMNADPELTGAAIDAAYFVDEQVLPGLKFHDFETFYSCSFKPFGWRDPVSTIEPQNNLSLQWTCDQFLSMYKLTGDRHWLSRGEYALDLLSFYHQVWTPPHYRANVFGGFGVMNTDGEWNDGRQSRFVHTYADYYEVTGKVEYLERAIAACRASFAQMDIEENHANSINATIQRRLNGVPIGLAPENMYHDGPGRDIGGWSGLNWSAGGGLTASAYLERKFGAVLVDGKSRRAIPVDGVTAAITSWNGSDISLNISSSLTHLQLPYKSKRNVLVRFRHLQDRDYRVSLNGRRPAVHAASELAQGLPLRV